VTRYLLDVNVLIALIDPTHVQHDRAHDWFARTGRRAWATCPLTENGVLRIVGNSRYPSSPGNPAAVAELMSLFLALGGREFWPDDVSLFDPTRVDTTRLLNSARGVEETATCLPLLTHTAESSLPLTGTWSPLQ